MPQTPAGWEETTLGEVVNIQTWKWIPSSERLEYWKYEIIGANWIIWYMNSYLLDWEFILTWRVWTIWEILYKVWKFHPSDNVLCISEKKNVSIRFLSYYLKTLSLKTLNCWSTQPLVTQTQYRNLPIHLPPLPEQQAIAAVLSSFDDKIELLRAENQTLEQMGQELFKERFGKWKVGDELPEGWRVGKITEIIKRETISYKCDKKDLDDKGKTPILDQGTTGLYGYTSRDPDFIATKDNPVIIFTNHTCNFWFIDYPFCAIQNVLPYRWINGYDEYFLYFMTKGSIKFTEYKGHRPSFVALDFVIPPIELAQEFSKIAEGILKKISWNKEQIQTLSATRDQLLPKLMSGEVRVEF